MTDKRLPPLDLVVTMDGKPMEDQAEGVRLFKEACLREAEAKHDERAEALARSSFNPDIHVPGLWRCAKCGFVLAQSNLNVADGTVTARDEAGDKCPNDNAPLWRVTWKERAKDLGDALEAAHARRVAEVAQINSNHTRSVANLDGALATFRRVTRGIAAAREKQLAVAIEERDRLRERVRQLENQLPA